MEGVGKRHNQKVSDALMVCSACKDGNCSDCVDRIMAILQRPLLCKCKRANHADLRDGEPRSRQIADPFTGDVHAPGLTIKENGDIVD